MGLKVLSEKQVKFCEAYLRNGGNALQACIEAGYSEKTSLMHSSKMLDNRKIQDQLTKSYESSAKNLNMTFAWKMTKLKRVIEEYIPDDPEVKLNPSHVKVALQAINELNKMQGDFAPDKRIAMNVDATKNKLEEVKLVYKDY